MQQATTIVIFGATGDLSTRKLLPALLDLFQKEYLPSAFQIVGFARSAYSDQEFQTFAKDAISKKQHNHPNTAIDNFLTHLHYQQGDLTNDASYEKLTQALIALDGEFGQCSNKLFYLAVPPSMYESAFQNLANSGLSVPCSGETGWTRVLVEKPFGRDAATAQTLDKTLGLLFKEEQIFRIDHYLAKETLQNILMFRFSNALFEPIWNSTHIEKVEIKLHETLGVEERGAFYSDVGALRDVGQNHILQMLTFIAMENPGKLEPERIRHERTQVLCTLKPLAIDERITRGQYKGFRNEPSVPKDSETETFFRLEAYIDNERWSGVPFMLESGKKMKETKTEISVYFKKTESCLCPPSAEQHHQNILTFRIQPDEGISICFWAKRPGFAQELDTKTLSFLYSEAGDSLHLPDAYERVLFDCIRGDQTLFTSTEEVLAAWAFITPVLEQWSSVPLQEYKPGSKGPVKT